MLLTMASRKAFQHSVSWARVWRMTSSLLRLPTADKSEGTMWRLSMLILLWKEKTYIRHTCTKKVNLASVYHHLTIIVVNGSETESASTVLSWKQNLQNTFKVRQHARHLARSTWETSRRANATFQGNKLVHSMTNLYSLIHKKCQTN